MLHIKEVMQGKVRTMYIFLYIQKGVKCIDFFTEAITTLSTLLTALGAGLGVWGIVNLLEGYGSDNAASKSQGIKQLMAGAGIAITSQILIPLLSGLFG